MIADIINNPDSMTRITCSHKNSLPKPQQHYNDIDLVTLFISLNTIHNITPPTSPDPYATLLNDCFLSAPLPFLHNCNWDLNKPPNSYHEATN